MAASIKKQFQQAFKDARKRSGMTQREAADASSIALGTLRRWEQGVNEPDVDSLVVLADLYGVTVGELVGARDGSAPSLTDDEHRLLDYYRATDDRGRLAIMSVAESQQGVEGAPAGYLTGTTGA